MDWAKHVANLMRDHYKYRLRGKRADDPRVLMLEEAKTIYVPVPKAANSSTKLALCPTLGIDTATVTEVQKDPRLPMIRFSELADRIEQDWLLFTVVRDPWTRAYSAWRDKVIGQEARLRSLQAMGIQSGDDFETFLKALNRWPRLLLNDHFIPQADLLAAPLSTGRLKVLKSETIADRWPEISKQIVSRGAPAPAPIGHANQSGPRHSHHFTPSEAGLIRRLYARDFELFGYSPEPPNAN